MGIVKKGVEKTVNENFTDMKGNPNASAKNGDLTAIAQDVLKIKNHLKLK